MKVVINDNGGSLEVADFPLFINDTNVTSGVANKVEPNSYVVSETNQPGYAATFSGDCDANGNITVAAGESKTCTITNDDEAAPPPPPPPPNESMCKLVDYKVQPQGGQYHVQLSWDDRGTDGPWKVTDWSGRNIFDEGRRGHKAEFTLDKLVWMRIWVMVDGDWVSKPGCQIRPDRLVPSCPVCDAVRYREEPGYDVTGATNPDVKLTMSWTTSTPFDPVFDYQTWEWDLGFSPVFYAKADVPFSFAWGNIAYPAEVVQLPGQKAVYRFYQLPPTGEFVILAGLVEGPVDWSSVERFRDVHGLDSVAKFYPCSDSYWVGDLSVSPLSTQNATTFRLTMRPGTNPWEIEQFLLENFNPTAGSQTALATSASMDLNMISTYAQAAMDEGFVDLEGLELKP